MLLPLLDKPLVQHVIERVRRATKLDFVVLAYPLLDNPSFAPVLKSFTDTPGVPLGSWAHQGDEADLIERHLRAAEAYGADVIVRIPCDNPCVDPHCIDCAVEEYLKWPYIFKTNADAVYLQSRRIDGLGCEVLSMSRWKWLDERTKGHADYREHPHKYFYDNEIDVWFSRTPQPTDIRLDVNTQEDYARIRDIYEYFGHNQFPAQDIVQYLTTKEVPHESIQRAQSSGNPQPRA